MNRYLVYKEFHKHNGDTYPAGSHFDKIGDHFVDDEGRWMCLVHSQKAFDCLVGDDDRYGIERGALIEEIDQMFAWDISEEIIRKRLLALWNDETALLYNRGGTIDDTPWLWNEDFYQANMEDLRYIHDLLKEAEV